MARPRYTMNIPIIVLMIFYLLFFSSSIIFTSLKMLFCDRPIRIKSSWLLCVHLQHLSLPYSNNVLSSLLKNKFLSKKKIRYFFFFFLFSFFFFLFLASLTLQRQPSNCKEPCENRYHKHVYVLLRKH